MSVAYCPIGIGADSVRARWPTECEGMNLTLDELYFGATRIHLLRGTPLDHLQSGLYIGANARGVMGAGLPADIRRVAGSEVETELRAQGPLLIGQAYLTSAGELQRQGVGSIAHGVVTAEPGGSAALDVSIKALLGGLRLLEDAGCRSVTIPQIGWRVQDLDYDDAAAELARVTITHLRRNSRLTDLNIVSRHADYLESLWTAVSALLRSGRGDATK